MRGTDVVTCKTSHEYKLFLNVNFFSYRSYFSLYKLVGKIETDNYVIYLFHCVWFFFFLQISAIIFFPMVNINTSKFVLLFIVMSTLFFLIKYL